GGGGREGGRGGGVALTGGGGLAVGPAPVRAGGVAGGVITLTAGSRVGGARDVRAALRVVNGTQIRASALRGDGFGGSVQLEGCDVTLEPRTVLSVDGGSRGHAGHLTVVARERLAAQSLATRSALPGGASA